MYAAPSILPKPIAITAFEGKSAEPVISLVSSDKQSRNVTSSAVQVDPKMKDQGNQIEIELEVSLAQGNEASLQINTVTKVKTVEETVRSYFTDTPILAEVAQCESHFRQVSTNGSILRGIVNSRDVGVMQINERYHAKRAKELGYDIYTLEGNMAYAKVLYNQSGAQPWSASSPCWGKSKIGKAAAATVAMK